MAVYVDSAKITYRSMKMSHMLADTTEELLDMASRIGINHRWIQKPTTPKEHFDICEQMRKEALRLGAIEVSSKDLVRIIQRKALKIKETHRAKLDNQKK